MARIVHADPQQLREQLTQALHDAGLRPEFILAMDLAAAREWLQGHGFWDLDQQLASTRFLLEG